MTNQGQRRRRMDQRIPQRVEQAAQSMADASSGPRRGYIPPDTGRIQAARNPGMNYPNEQQAAAPNQGMNYGNGQQPAGNGYYAGQNMQQGGWYGQENLEAGDMVNLLYASLRAILKDVIPLKLIRRVYECRLLTVNGEFALPEGLSEDDPVRYALEYTMKAGYSSLFAFALKEEAFARYEKIVSSEMRRRAGVNFRALAILESIDANSGILYNLRDEKDG